MNPFFNVELENVKTASGRPLPRVRAVVNQETKEPVSIVSDRYRLVPYRAAMDLAEQYAESFGTFSQKVSLGRHGGSMVASFDFRDRSAEVAKDDFVGFRLLFENSYNASKSVRLWLGALRLICLNGMVSSTGLFDTRLKHVGTTAELKFPEPAEIVDQFTKTVGHWKNYAKHVVTYKEAQQIRTEAFEAHLIPEKIVDSPLGESDKIRVWDIYNDFTQHITHSERAGASPVGKVQRLRKVDRFFRERFN